MLDSDAKLRRTESTINVIHGDLRFSLESWQFFRITSTTQGFLDVFNSANAGYLYDHIAQSIIHKVISNLVSFFDKSNKFEIFGAKRFDEKSSFLNLVEALRDESFRGYLLESARQWPGPSIERNEETWLEYESRFLNDVKNIFESDQFKNIKKFRNWYVGHKMYIERNWELPKILDVEVILDKTVPIYEAAELIFNGSSTDLSDVIDWSQRDTKYLAKGIRFVEDGVED